MNRVEVSKVKVCGVRVTLFRVSRVKVCKVWGSRLTVGRATLVGLGFVRFALVGLGFVNKLVSMIVVFSRGFGV